MAPLGPPVNGQKRVFAAAADPAGGDAALIPETVSG
jgi:hypothetical protein